MKKPVGYGSLQFCPYAASLLATLICLMMISAVGAQPSTAPSHTDQPGVTVQVLALGTSWVSAAVDGREVYEGTMGPGQRRVWSGKRTVRLRVGNAGALRVTYNGRILAPLGRSGQVLARTFTAPPAAQVVPPPTPAPEPKPQPPPEPVAPEPAQPAPQESAPEEPSAEPVRPESLFRADTLLQYVYAAALAALLVVACLVLAAVWRERRSMERANQPSRRTVQRIEVLAREKIGRGKTLYLIESEGRQFLVGTGDLQMLGEVASDTASHSSDPGS